MDDLLSIIFFVVIGAISIISKIVSSKKEKDNLLIKRTSSPKKIKVTNRLQSSAVSSSIRQSSVQETPQWRVSEINTASVNKINQHKTKNSLIPEENEVAQPPPAQSKPIPITEENRISETAIGLEHQGVSKSIKKDLKFAIICHEILGKPKALQ